MAPFSVFCSMGSSCCGQSLTDRHGTQHFGLKGFKRFRKRVSSSVWMTDLDENATTLVLRTHLVYKVSGSHCWSSPVFLICYTTYYYVTKFLNLTTKNVKLILMIVSSNQHTMIFNDIPKERLGKTSDSPTGELHWHLCQRAALSWLSWAWPHRSTSKLTYDGILLMLSKVCEVPYLNLCKTWIAHKSWAAVMIEIWNRFK